MKVVRSPLFLFLDSLCYDLMQFEEFDVIGKSSTVGNEVVVRYRDKETHKMVAFRRFMLRSEDGIPCMTMRQVSLQKVMAHKNVARYIYIFI